MFILAPMRSMKGMMRLRPGRQRAGVAAEALDRVVLALRHDLDPAEHQDDGQDQHHKDEYCEAFHRRHSLSEPAGPVTASIAPGGDSAGRVPASGHRGQNRPSTHQPPAKP